MDFLPGMCIAAKDIQPKNVPMMIMDHGGAIVVTGSLLLVLDFHSIDQDNKFAQRYQLCAVTSDGILVYDRAPHNYFMKNFMIVSRG